MPVVVLANMTQFQTWLTIGQGTNTSTT